MRNRLQLLSLLGIVTCGRFACTTFMFARCHIAWRGETRCVCMYIAESGGVMVGTSLRGNALKHICKEEHIGRWLRLTSPDIGESGRFRMKYAMVRMKSATVTGRHRHCKSILCCLTWCSRSIYSSVENVFFFKEVWILYPQHVLIIESTRRVYSYFFMYIR